MKGQKCFALPQKLNSDPAHRRKGHPKTYIRSGTGLIFITCWSWAVKLFRALGELVWISLFHHMSIRWGFEHALMVSAYFFFCAVGGSSPFKRR